MVFPKRPRRAHRINAFCERRLSAIHGWGVFARRAVPAGTRLLEYLGERVSKDESNARGLALQAAAARNGGPAVYIFEVNEEWDLDGDKPYNVARFVNHSCAPNCEVVNEEDRLFLYALRDLRAGEELTFDYGYDLQHFREHPCQCGSPSCPGYIVSAAQRPQLRKILARSRRLPAESGA